MSFSNIVKQDLLKSKIEHNLKNEQDLAKKEFLKQVFLESGSITDPNLEYHLEISFKSVDFLDKAVKILDYFGVEARVTTRKNFYILYIKEFDQISNFLSLVGAYKSVLELQNIKVLKEMRNNINRVVNCETANLTKTINTSVRQREKIKYLQDMGYLDNVPKELKEIAFLRLEYSDSTLEELSNLTEIKLSKSGVNYRLKKLEDIYEKRRGV